MNTITKLLATVFYSGYFPLAPGTVGTLVALAVYLLLPHSVIDSPLFFMLPLLAIFPAVYITSKAEEDMEKDDKRIVLDEFVGYFIAVMFLPKTLLIAISAFILFRLFDILKPPPVYDIQYMKKGWGIMMDDVLAGIYANLLLQIGYYLFIYK